MKTFAKSLVRSAPLPAKLQEKVLFFGKCGYWPDFDNPRSFNEKVNWRKLNSTNALYVQCCDKLAVRDFVRDRIGEEYLIPVLFEGETITPEKLHELGDDIVVKANHDSGSVCIIRENTFEACIAACRKILPRLKSNYGRTTHEWWYARVRPRVYVEKFIGAEDAGPPFDVKFFVFNGSGAEPPKIVVEVDHDRGTPNHHRTFYDENGEILRWNDEGIRLDSEPNRLVPFPCPEHLEKMRELAVALADPFSHVRVDLYNVEGRIYFGELTFSDGGGRSRWSPREFDFQMGEWWTLDPASECPGDDPGSLSPTVKQEFVRQDPVKRIYHRAKKQLSASQEQVGIFLSRVLRFFALPYAVTKLVDWSECPKNRIAVFFDHLYLFFALRYFPDNYASCRLWEKPRSEWKYYYGRGYDPLAVARRNRQVRRPDSQILFEDKEVAYTLCQAFALPQPHQYGVIDPGEDLSRFIEGVFEQPHARRVFLKPVVGDGGRGACVITRDEERGGFVARQITRPEDPIPLENFELTLRSVVQEGVCQHPDVAGLFPHALNTTRIATLFSPEGEPLVVGAFLRIGRGANFVDNGDQGGLGAKIDLGTGRLASVATDNRGRPFATHPDTGFAFDELTLPFWEDVKSLALEVQRHFAPWNKFVGMDIGFGENGPVLIEVNDIFDSGRFESVVGPHLRDDEVRRILLEYGMITHGKFDS